MSAILPYLLSAGGAVILLVLAFFKGQSAGTNKERNKQLQERQKANDIADEVQNDVGAMTPEQRKEALRKWGNS